MEQSYTMQKSCYNDIMKSQPLRVIEAFCLKKVISVYDITGFN